MMFHYFLPTYTEAYISSSYLDPQSPVLGMKNKQEKVHQGNMAPKYPPTQIVEFALSIQILFEILEKLFHDSMNVSPLKPRARGRSTASLRRTHRGFSSLLMS